MIVAFSKRAESVCKKALIKRRFQTA